MPLQLPLVLQITDKSKKQIETANLRGERADLQEKSTKQRLSCPAIAA